MHVIYSLSLEGFVKHYNGLVVLTVVHITFLRTKTVACVSHSCQVDHHSLITEWVSLRFHRRVRVPYSSALLHWHRAIMPSPQCQSSNLLMLVSFIIISNVVPTIHAISTNKTLDIKLSALARFYEWMYEWPLRLNTVFIFVCTFNHVLMALFPIIANRSGES